MSLTLGSWNVHGAVGTDGRFAPERVERVIADLDLDLLALQEVESRHGRAPWVPALAHRLGYRVVEGPTMAGEGAEGGWYGNVLLSRLPLAGEARLDLSVDGREPRGAILVEVGDWQVVATHLGLKRWERRRQVERLLAELAPGRPTVVLGDLNEWLPSRHLLAGFRGRFAGSRGPRTWPARWPLLALDRILVRPRARLAHLSALRTPLTRVASDHLPLVARLHPPRTPRG